MQRILHLDLARGFIVLIMPSVHVMMLYSQPVVQQSLLGDTLRFLAEGPGAQLFMFIMGASLVLSKNITPKKVWQRTVLLIIGAFGLNLFKFNIPLDLELLPASFLLDFPLTATEFFLLGDIFHFAAIAYPLTFIVSRLTHASIWAGFIALTVMVVSPAIWDIHTGYKVCDQVLQYFTGGPPNVFFPVFPWLVYPLMGVVLSRMLDNKLLTTLGLMMLFVSLGLPATIERTTHYRTMPADTLFHLSIVLLWLSLFRYCQRKIKANLFFRLLNFCSHNISLIYIIQWLLIFWLFSIPGYLKLSFWPTISWMSAITIATLGFTWLLTKSSTHNSQPTTPN